MQTLTGLDVALEFQLEPGWHIYWKNPGDSGEATTVKWNLPEGWSEVDLMFPTPHAIDAGGVINYGYENKVTLLARLKPPVDYSGETVNLTGEASY
jgi:thiol:disulfide interchange protein DsbD